MTTPARPDLQALAEQITKAVNLEVTARNEEGVILRVLEGSALAAEVQQLRETVNAQEWEIESGEPASRRKLLAQALAHITALEAEVQQLRTQLAERTNEREVAADRFRNAKAKTDAATVDLRACREALAETMTALWDMQSTPDCWCDRALEGHSIACQQARAVSKKHGAAVLAALPAEPTA